MLPVPMFRPRTASHFSHLGVCLGLLVGACSFPDYDTVDAPLNGAAASAGASLDPGAGLGGSTSSGGSASNTAATGNLSGTGNTGSAAGSGVGGSSGSAGGAVSVAGTSGDGAGEGGCGSADCGGTAVPNIVVAASSPSGMKGWNGTGAAAVVSLQHTPQFARGQARIVLVGVAASGTGAGPFTVTYDDQPMLKAIELEHESRQTYAAIYYLLDDKLPEAGTPAEVKAVFHESAWWGFGGIDVLEAENVAQKAPLKTGSSSGAVCDGTTARGVSLTFDAPGSLVFGVLSTRHSAAPPVLLQAPPVTKTWSQSVTNGGDPHSGAAAWVLDDNTRNLEWSLNGCDTSVSAGVVFERLADQ